LDNISLFLGILAAPGSGEMWLRKMIEQVTGFHTGSVATNSSHEYFEGDGEKSKVSLPSYFLFPH
jgi:hypothetical protein